MTVISHCGIGKRTEELTLTELSTHVLKALYTSIPRLAVFSDPIVFSLPPLLPRTC